MITSSRRFKDRCRGFRLALELYARYDSVQSYIHVRHFLMSEVLHSTFHDRVTLLSGPTRPAGFLTTLGTVEDVRLYHLPCINRKCEVCLAAPYTSSATEFRLSAPPLDDTDQTSLTDEPKVMQLPGFLWVRQREFEAAKQLWDEL